MLAEAFDFGMDVKRFITDLLECFRTLLLIKIGNCEQLMQQSDDDTETLRALAQAHPVESIHQKLNLLMQTADDLRYSFQPRLTLETSFLSIIATGDVIGVETLLGKLDTALGMLPDQPLEQKPPSSPPTEPAQVESEAETAKEKKTDATPAEQTLPDSPPPKPTFTLEHAGHSED